MFKNLFKDLYKYFFVYKCRMYNIELLAIIYIILLYLRDIELDAFGRICVFIILITHMLRLPIYIYINNIKGERDDL